MSSTIKAYLRLAATTVADGRKRFRDSNPHRQLTWIYPLRDPYEATTRWYRSITVVCDEVERWEKLTDLKEPVTIAMVHDLHQQQDALTPFGLATVIYDWTVVGMYIGTRLSEWAQQDGVTSLPQVALTDDGDPIAFTIHDVAFFGLGRRQLQLSYALTHLTEIITATIRWRTQKNKRKGEKKTLVRAPSYPIMCAVSALTRITRRWLAFSLPDSYPLAVFTTTGLPTGPITFVCAKHITAAFRASAQRVYAITDLDALARWTSHSLRVGACVGLHAAGIEAESIQHALRWKSLAFKQYLRNIPAIANRCAVGVRTFDPDRLDIIPVHTYNVLPVPVTP
jgi:hypothetical protein